MFTFESVSLDIFFIIQNPAKCLVAMDVIKLKNEKIYSIHNYNICFH